MSIRNFLLCVVLLLMLTAAYAGAQTMIISATVECGGNVIGPYLFGFNPTASDGVDSFDVPEPPIEPDSQLSAYFYMREPDLPEYNRWRADIRNLYCMEDNYDTWIMDVITPLVGETCTISLDFVEGPEYPAMVIVKPHPLVAHNIQVPGTCSFEVIQVTKPIVFTLTSFWSVSNEDGTWGRIKQLYR
jgi:hypothetical protein